ncbi:MAG: hypothetical protein IIB95_07885 [Candidatus Marinimicrobia bacterium]|nr:hypothetical protein [Candidatus Neomarinimicrobiota bacterium]
MNIFLDIVILLAIVCVGYIYSKQIKSLKETVADQKDFIESAKMITEMFDIPKIKEIYDEKMKHVEEKSKEKIEEITSAYLASFEKSTEKWSDAGFEYIEIIISAFLLLKPKTREGIISKHELKHTKQNMKRILDRLGADYFPDEDIVLRDAIADSIDE